MSCLNNKTTKADPYMFNTIRTNREMDKEKGVGLSRTGTYNKIKYKVRTKTNKEEHVTTKPTVCKKNKNEQQEYEPPTEILVFQQKQLRNNKRLYIQEKNHLRKHAKVSLKKTPKIEH